MFICAGFAKTGFGLHFAPHSPRAEFLRYPGSGGLRRATRPAPQRPPKARPSAGGRRARAPGARVCGGGRGAGPARVGAPGACACGRRGARPSGAAGLPGGGARREEEAEPEAGRARGRSKGGGRYEPVWSEGGSSVTLQVPAARLRSRLKQTV